MNMNNESTIIIGFIRQGLVLLAAFGFAVSDSQQAAIIGFAGAAIILGDLALTFYNRSKVFSKQTTKTIADAATYLPAGTSVDVGNPPTGNPDAPALG